MNLQQKNKEANKQTNKQKKNAKDYNIYLTSVCTVLASKDMSGYLSQCNDSIEHKYLFSVV